MFKRFTHFAAATVVFVGLVAAGTSTATPSPDREGPVAVASACSEIRLGGRWHVFYKSGLTCAKAKSLARYVHRTHRRPDARWRCTSGTNFRQGGGCRRRATIYFGWHPFD